ncbi:RelA/SpoT domain-containing protein [Sphingomonadaceae bacterium OTU29MARTA1]|nr:RelA/SpoT domain-containing protein [Sphingomonadaceae bacterium OTU29MARTA1]
MTKEQEFLARWDHERDSYSAWGALVSSKVQDELRPLVAPVSVDYFLKVGVQPRVKDDMKLVEKAFYRSKGYTNPFEAITDKVGTRFVVLLGSETRIVEQALLNIPKWELSKDRDFEKEQSDSPLTFDYAALHYIVRPTEDVEYEGVPIAAGTPCEVQIKTLLQHAFSELTHDTIYKPQIQATAGMRRSAAKAMALLEATNDYFEKVSHDVAEILGAVRNVTAELSSYYKQIIGFDPKPSIVEGLLLEAYEAETHDDWLAELKQLVADKPFLTDVIKRRVAEKNPVFFQPSVLLAYLAIDRSPRKAQARWPLTPAEIEPLLNDLGESTF